jgi:hypothetical protein
MKAWNLLIRVKTISCSRKIFHRRISFKLKLITEYRGVLVSTFYRGFLLGLFVVPTFVGFSLLSSVTLISNLELAVTFLYQILSNSVRSTREL